MQVILILCFQITYFIYLKEFFQNVHTEHCKLEKLDFENFNEREFEETVNNLNINSILIIGENHVSYLLDKFAIKKSLIEKSDLRQDHGSLKICYI